MCGSASRSGVQPRALSCGRLNSVVQRLPPSERRSSFYENGNACIESSAHECHRLCGLFEIVACAQLSHRRCDRLGIDRESIAAVAAC